MRIRLNPAIPASSAAFGGMILTKRGGRGRFSRGAMGAGGRCRLRIARRAGVVFAALGARAIPVPRQRTAACRFSRPMAHTGVADCALCGVPVYAAHGARMVPIPRQRTAGRETRPLHGVVAVCASDGGVPVFAALGARGRCRLRIARRGGFRGPRRAYGSQSAPEDAGTGKPSPTRAPTIPVRATAGMRIRVGAGFPRPHPVASRRPPRRPASRLSRVPRAARFPPPASALDAGRHGLSLIHI